MNTVKHIGSFLLTLILFVACFFLANAIYYFLALLINNIPFLSFLRTSRFVTAIYLLYSVGIYSFSISISHTIGSLLSGAGANVATIINGFLCIVITILFVIFNRPGVFQSIFAILCGIFGGAYTALKAINS